MLDWKSYEELTKTIYEIAGASAGIKVVGCGNNCKHLGKSGVSHQIDVLTSHSDGFHEYLTDIECKYWKQKINKDIVMKVHEVVEDCKFSKGIIVSKKGFTPDAVYYANFVGVGLVELRELTEQDWKGRIQQIVVNISAMSPVLDKVECLIDPNKNPGKIFDGSEVIETNKVVLEYSDGKKQTFVEFLKENLINELYSKKTTDSIEKTINLESGTILRYPSNDFVYVDGYKICGHLDIIKTTSIIGGKEAFLYIMKSIFEGKTYLVKADGSVEDKTDTNAPQFQ